jgi:hypothetical protein
MKKPRSGVADGAAGPGVLRKNYFFFFGADLYSKLVLP